MSTEYLMNMREAVEASREWAYMLRDGSGWAVDFWDQGHSLYRRSPPTDYQSARRMVAEGRHAAALVKMGWEWDEAMLESEGRSGRVVDRVRASVSRQKQMEAV